MIYEKKGTPICMHRVTGEDQRLCGPFGDIDGYHIILFSMLFWRNLNIVL